MLNLTNEEIWEVAFKHWVCVCVLSNSEAYKKVRNKQVESFF